MKTKIVVVYKKTKKSKKTYITILEDVFIDDVLNMNKKKHILPIKYEIIEIGVGYSFYEKYKKKFNIKN